MFKIYPCTILNRTRKKCTFQQKIIDNQQKHVMNVMNTFMQFRFITNLTCEEYVRLEIWKTIMVSHCLIHPGKDCVFTYIGTYASKSTLSPQCFIPYVWSKDDIKKLLCAIDREDPKGKRDYAIFLIAIRLGLRIGDIRSLKKSSMNWNRKTINVNQPF